MDNLFVKYKLSISNCYVNVVIAISFIAVFFMNSLLKTIFMLAGVFFIQFNCVMEKCLSLYAIGLSMSHYLIGKKPH